MAQKRFVVRETCEMTLHEQYAHSLLHLLEANKFAVQSYKDSLESSNRDSRTLVIPGYTNVGYTGWAPHVHLETSPINEGWVVQFFEVGCDPRAIEPKKIYTHSDAVTTDILMRDIADFLGKRAFKPY